MLDKIIKYKTTGTLLAILELQLFLGISEVIYIVCDGLHHMDRLSYYWMMLTILTAKWESTYMQHRNKVHSISLDLIKNNQHVWTNMYTLDHIYPGKFARLFYGEYGAYADKEYMSRADIWSALIESTHALFCGSISTMACISGMLYLNTLNHVLLALAMGGQCMNSILYLGDYYGQVYNKDHINYPSTTFPLGYCLIYRPFLYINVLWVVMPVYVSGNILYKLIYI